MGDGCAVPMGWDGMGWDGLSGPGKGGLVAGSVWHLGGQMMPLSYSLHDRYLPRDLQWVGQYRERDGKSSCCCLLERLWLWQYSNVKCASLVVTLGGDEPAPARATPKERAPRGAGPVGGWTQALDDCAK